MANLKVGIILLLYMIIITIHTPLVPQNANKLIKGGDYNVLLYSMLLDMSTNSLPYIYIYIYIHTLDFFFSTTTRKKGKGKRKKDQVIFLLNVNFIIKIADKKKSKFNYQQWNGRNGRMGPDSRLYKEWESRYNQPHHYHLTF
jgi:membrane-associated HD superfamily phosphohydrolase